MAAAAQWQNQPLPAGWEAKYDSRSGKYFFIDHSTKTTSWEDPRLMYMQAPHAQTQWIAHGQAQAVHSQQQAHQYWQQQQQQQQQQQHQQHQQQQQHHHSHQQQQKIPTPQHHPHANEDGRKGSRSPRSAAHSPHRAAAGHGEEIALQTFPKPKCGECGEMEVDSAGELCWRCDLKSKYGIDMEEDEGESHLGVDEVAEGHTQKSSELRFGVVREKYDTLKLEFPTADEDLIQTLLIRCSNNTDKVFHKLVNMGYERQSVPPPGRGQAQPAPSKPHTDIKELKVGVHREPYLKLKKQFPTVDDDRLQALLIKCNNNPDKVVSELKSLASSPGQAERPRSRSPAGETSSPAPAPTHTAPAKKKQLRDKLKANYPDLADAVLDMALETCDYDEDRARQLLRALSTSSPTSTGRPDTASTTLSPTADRSPRHTTSATTTTTTTITVTTATPAAGDRRAMSSSPRPANRTAAGAASPRSGAEKTGTGRPRSAVGRPAASTPTTTGSTTSTDSHSGKSHRDGRQKDRKGSPKPASQQKKSTPPSSQPKSHVYHSALRCKPVGPNPALARGPDDTLLLKEYSEWSGPNKENYKGPQIKTGPNASLARGANPELVRGPQACNRMGPVQASCNYIHA